MNGIPYGVVDHMNPKLQNVVSSDVVSDDPTKITQIIHDKSEYIDIDAESLYNKFKICVGRLIQVPAKISVHEGHGDLGEILTGIMIKESNDNLFGFVLGES